MVTTVTVDLVSWCGLVGNVTVVRLYRLCSIPSGGIFLAYFKQLQKPGCETTVVSIITLFAYNFSRYSSALNGTSVATQEELEDREHFNQEEKYVACKSDY